MFRTLKIIILIDLILMRLIKVIYSNDLGYDVAAIFIRDNDKILHMFL